jgi:hypothetical protein
VKFPTLRNYSEEETMVSLGIVIVGFIIAAIPVISWSAGNDPEWWLFVIGCAVIALGMLSAKTK